MKNHKEFSLCDTLNFPEPVTTVFMAKKNKLVIVTGKSVYLYKGNSKTEKIKQAK